MQMVKLVSRGDFKKTTKFLNKLLRRTYLDVLDKYGREGVVALSAATPRDTGKTAESWDYEIVQNEGSYSIFWTNSNNNKGVNIAVILQYGHGTGSGGYVVGRDYINPAIRPVFDHIADAAWKEVVNS